MPLKILKRNIYLLLAPCCIYKQGGYMKNLLSIFGKKDDSEINHKSGILNKPGDRLEARITDSNRRVVKYSATQYPNGTIVETKVTKRKE